MFPANCVDHAIALMSQASAVSQAQWGERSTGGTGQEICQLSPEKCHKQTWQVRRWRPSSSSIRMIRTWQSDIGNTAARWKPLPKLPLIQSMVKSQRLTAQPQPSPGNLVKVLTALRRRSWKSLMLIRVRRVTIMMEAETPGNCREHPAIVWGLMQQ